ncbi:DUF418 domain-containing protein [Streptomyces sp. NBC_00690]|uniref:DUF418 domain-containing protein n=1 Tax=Streptomyces sp. NBC_00690 TaxID=2975808 RepID=UPI002E2C0DAD|nr:DUF418 domain-containing protein [Streptomyces sp. NBC_00690]
MSHTADERSPTDDTPQEADGTPREAGGAPREQQLPGPTAHETNTRTVRGPVERIADVDVLRGFALLGILLVNITFIASAHRLEGVHDPSFDGPLDRSALQLTVVLLESKFYLLFSFLFGYSFTLQMRSAERSGARFTSRFLRRCAGLLAIGVFHAVVLFPGDILTTYALLGLILLAARGTRPRSALRTAILLFGITALLYLLLGFLIWLDGGASVDTPETAAGIQDTLAALRGDPASVIGENLARLSDVLLIIVLLQGPAALAAFLVGLAAGKKELLANVSAHRTLLRRLQWIGFPVGLAGAVFYAWASQGTQGMDFLSFAVAVDLLTAPLLTAAYAATVLQLVATARGARIGRALAPAGRMALTNYLSQSLVLAVLFTGFGFALVGRVGPATAVLIALSLFAAQLVVSRWWMGRHAYGPVEWVLRTITNARRPRWRNEQ